MNKTILIKPNCSNGYQKSIKDLRAIEPPMWLSILARKYENPVIIDAELENLSPREVRLRVLELSRVSVFEEKANKIIILATGNHPSAYIQQEEEMNIIKKSLEYYFDVETSNTLPCDIMDYGSPRHFLIDYSKYKCHTWQSWSNNNIRSPYGVLYTSISCPFSCEFCVVKNFYGHTYKERPLEDVYSDLDYFAQHSIVNLKIMDELFVFKKQRVLDICNYIIRNNYLFNIWAYARIDIMDEDMLQLMAAAGINWLAYGIETGSEKIRKEVLKGNFDNNKVRDVIAMTKHYGIRCLGNYMFGFWEDNLETMQETLDLATELNCEYSNFYCVSAFPNSPLYEDMQKRGISLTRRYSEYSQMSERFLPLPTRYLLRKEVLKFRDEAFNTYFTSERYINHMKETFGEQIVNELSSMTNKKIIRKKFTQKY
jgi:radical SAM superfamily enzyme YgiQ (UPF0313 family)